MRRMIYCFLFQCIILCDLSLANPLHGNNIRQAHDTEFPFVVSIGNKKTSGPDENHFCTGALITRRHVLTSAHCLVGEKLQDIRVSVGSADLRHGNNYGVSAGVTYDQWASDNGEPIEFDDNDIAILALDRAVENVTPATLSTAKNFKLSGTDATVAGWGVSNEGKIPRIMETAKVHVVSNPECIKNIEKVLGERLIVQTRYLCTNAKPYTLLQCGDSGGPLFNSKHEIIGINDSTCPRLKKLTPDVMNLHVGINYYRNFIKDAIDTL